MRNLIFLSLSFLMPALLNAQLLESPSKALKMQFAITANGTPTYTFTYKNHPVVKTSVLGFELKDKPALKSGFSIVKSETGSVDETWKPVLGEQSQIRNKYRELRVELLQKATERTIVVVFRMFDEGLAFRYEFPKQKNLDYFVVSKELTQFNLTADHNAFWIPGDFESQEYVYNETVLSAIDVSKLDMKNGVGFKGIMPNTRVQSPLMMKTAQNLYLNIFEAATINYPVMHLLLVPVNYSFTADLAPNATGDLAYLQAPFRTPWRTIMVSDDARDIVGSKMILNLNEPSKIDDTSWIKPMKYVGVWWEMHVGRATWDYSGSQNAQNTGGTELVGKTPHGATTENTKKYIDFAAKHGFDGVLVEGWNTGWEDWFGNWKEEVFDFTTPYPDFNVEEVSAYAKSKNVKMIMHHETSGSVTNYERRLDRAFDFMKKHGYGAIKSGYVGRIIPRGEAHDGQAMVNHFNYVPQRAAEQHIMINSHESSRPTGVHRTYPNYIAAEAARGNEFNAWSNGNPPSHETILPFTRLLGGPMDYTPGIFEIKMSYYDPKKTEQVHTTLAKQLALFVTMYSPLQMAADLPENYERYPDAFQFIKDVEVDWDETRILAAEPGDYLTIARKAKGKESWFIGAITDETARQSTLVLDFLTPGKKYTATIYEDGKSAHWKDNPKAYAIRTVTVTSKSKINLKLAAGGGTAISILPLK